MIGYTADNLSLCSLQNRLLSAVSSDRISERLVWGLKMIWLMRVVSILFLS